MIEIIGRKTCTTCRKAVALLEEKGAKFHFRDYTSEPLSVAELEEVLAKLKMSAAELLRSRDGAYKELGLTGKESDAVLTKHMADHPGLINRPIAVKGKKAILARPAETILEIV